MAKGDVVVSQAKQFGIAGSRKHQVASGSAGTILAGEPVKKVLGSAYVLPLATNEPNTSSPIVGIAADLSTDTASADGFVNVFDAEGSATYLCAPNTAASWDTQAEYNALVGDRVLFDLTSSTYTVLATDGANNGLVVEYLNISEVPSKVRFAIRNSCTYLT